MEKRIRIRTARDKTRVSPGADKVSIKTSHRSQLSTSDHQNRVRISRLVQLLRSSQLCCWLREIYAGKVAHQLLTAVLLLLLFWLLVEVHVLLPCLFLCACLFDGPLWRAVNTAWAWITAPEGAKVVENMPHTDGGNEVV